jgi:cbb3-type cytochrome oxidase subunit 3
MSQPVVRRRPRYVLGTFWLILAFIAVIGGFSDGQFSTVLLGIAMAAYSVYLYRGGRFGFVIW